MNIASGAATSMAGAMRASVIERSYGLSHLMMSFLRR